MYAATSPSDLRADAGSRVDRLLPVRVDGGVAVTLAKRRDGATIASERRERDGYKLRMPNRRDACEIAVVNTGGGVASGDRVNVRVTANAGTDAVITSPAAERVYAASSATPAAYDVAIEIGEGARIDWLPQETILFDRARIDRRISVDIAANATFLMAETVVFGRTARGEHICEGAFSDRWEIRRAGRLIHAEAVSRAGEISLHLQGSAIGNGAVAVGTLVSVAPDAEDAIDKVRATLSDDARSV
ncbi:MAG: urease accessory protein UreD, partial [Pseudomonadota bacterium]